MSKSKEKAEKPPRVARWLREKAGKREPIRLPKKVLDALCCKDCGRLLGKNGNVYFACMHGWHGKVWPVGVLLRAVAEHFPKWLFLPPWWQKSPRRALNDLLRLARLQGRA